MNVYVGSIETKQVLYLWRWQTIISQSSSNFFEKHIEDYVDWSSVLFIVVNPLADLD